jgi:hypothetical protein
MIPLLLRYKACPRFKQHARIRTPVITRTLLLASILPATAYCADLDLPAVAKTFDSQLASLEREVVSLAEAMPAAKYGFAPKEGEFAGVRTFAQQVTHLASVNFVVAAAILGEPSPVEIGKDENGPANLKTKDEIVDYLKRSFSYTHRAMRSITQENLMAEVQSAFGANKVSRLSMATIPQWHSFDHYGQMVVYARMCGVIPPASRRN